MTNARDTIFLEEATILANDAHPGNQYILRVSAPQAARRATPGSFAHITPAESVPMRRPLSIMRADVADGWLEFLYKPVGAGLEKMAEQSVGGELSVLAPIGNGFDLEATRPRILALGGGVGIPPMVFLAQQLRSIENLRPVVLMGSEVPFPFELVPAVLTSKPPDIVDAMSIGLLENWGVASLLASNAELVGTFRGHVTELARRVLVESTVTELEQTQIAACGPEPMLRAAAQLAAEYDLPCQLALEEYMACGVGGCAGCTVLVHGPNGDSMRRVCVDGPIFQANEIYPASGR